MSVRPTSKVTAAGLAGAAVTLLVALSGWEPEPEAAAAATTVLTFVAGWLVRERRTGEE